MDIIKEMEEEIDEEDVRIFDMYKGEEDEIDDEENYKRKRP